MHPASTGYVHITSPTAVDAPPDFHPGYLDECVTFFSLPICHISEAYLRHSLDHSPTDMALHKWGYKLSREFARRMPSYRGEVAGDHPAFSPSSALFARPQHGPVPVSTPDFEYTEEDERALEEHIQKVVSTAWHSVCHASNIAAVSDAERCLILPS